MFKKKGQNAIEFIIIFSFILLIMLIVMVFFGNYFSGFQREEAKNRANNFAKSVDKELELIRKVEPGYKRELILSQNDYNVTIYPSMIYINDTINKKDYYFNLIGEYKINKTKKKIEGVNMTVLIFEKKNILEQKDDVLFIGKKYVNN